MGGGRERKHVTPVGGAWKVLHSQPHLMRVRVMARVMVMVRVRVAAPDEIDIKHFRVLSNVLAVVEG